FDRRLLGSLRQQLFIVQRTGNECFAEFRQEFTLHGHSRLSRLRWQPHPFQRIFLFSRLNRFERAEGILRPNSELRQDCLFRVRRELEASQTRFLSPRRQRLSSVVLHRPCCYDPPFERSSAAANRGVQNLPLLLLALLGRVAELPQTVAHLLAEPGAQALLLALHATQYQRRSDRRSHSKDFLHHMLVAQQMNRARTKHYLHATIVSRPAVVAISVDERNRSPALAAPTLE